MAVPQDEPSQAPQASTSSHKLSAQSTTGPAAAFTSTPARSRRPSSLFPGLPPTVPRPDGAAAGEFGSPDQSSFAFSPFARKPSLHSRASQPKPQQQSQRQAMDEDEEGPAVEYEDDPEDIQDTDVILLGKTYFDCRQYARAALVLKKCKGVKGKFLCLYSDFLAAEKTSQQDTSPTLSKHRWGSSRSIHPPRLTRVHAAIYRSLVNRRRDEPQAGGASQKAQGRYRSVSALFVRLVFAVRKALGPPSTDVLYTGKALCCRSSANV